MTYTVFANRFHGGESEKQAIKAARKHDCQECLCGGPTIEREDGKILRNWQAAKPFMPANKPWWD